MNNNFYMSIYKQKDIAFSIDNRNLVIKKT